MLSDQIKQTIQEAYSRFLESRNLRARYGQKVMIAEIARTLGSIELDEEGRRSSDGHVCVVEAGTGTGKTVGYLLAAIPIAQALGKHLVVSTATVALQEQIVLKDLPELKAHSKLPVNFSLAKGRGRYLCLAKLDRQLNDFEAPAELPLGFPLEDSAPSDQDTIRLYQSMMDALSSGRWDGDRDNWPRAVEEERWRPITSNHRQCSGRRCSFVSSCSFFKSREQINGVDCIVTNHDLVLADLALGGGAILPAPEDTIYIFDEAHHLADKARDHFSHYSRVESTRNWLEQCEQSLTLANNQIGAAGEIQRRLEPLPEALAACRRALSHIQPLLLACLESSEQGPDDFGSRERRHRFAHGVVPEDIREAAKETGRAFARLTTAISQLSDEIGQCMESGSQDVPLVDLENWFPVIGSWLARAEANLELWLSYASEMVGDIPDARWIEKVEGGSETEVAIASSPILAAQALRELLWSRCCGAVLTSATLTALGKFERMIMRTGTPRNSNYHAVPSPFDYSRAILRIPPEACDAGNQNAMQHTQSLIDGLPRMLKENEGSLVLFSSRRQMLDVYDGLDSAWHERILLQDDRSKQETLAEHRRRIDQGQGSVIFGLASFAEGVDLPGDYCRHVVVAKIPFSVPDDPVEAALAEWIKERGGNPFMEISVPDASLRLIQACGRLIRSEQDQGIITIMDNRLATKHYGKAILASLPPFQRDI